MPFACPSWNFIEIAQLHQVCSRCWYTSHHFPFVSLIGFVCRKVSVTEGLLHCDVFRSQDVGCTAWCPQLGVKTKAVVKHGICTLTHGIGRSPFHGVFPIKTSFFDRAFFIVMLDHWVFSVWYSCGFNSAVPSDQRSTSTLQSFCRTWSGW